MSDSDDPNEELEEAAKQYFAVKKDLMQAEKDKAEMLELLREADEGADGTVPFDWFRRVAALLARFPR